MRSVLVYTVHKAASTFLHKLSIEICSELSLPYYSINDSKYHQIILDQSWESFIENLAETSACFGPIRSREKKGEVQPLIPKNVGDYSIILHLRDPRDVLTSLYFSHVYSHSRKKGGFDPSNESRAQWEEEGIDKYVVEIMPDIKERFEQVCPLIGEENVVYLKYKDLVSNYEGWLHGFLSAFLHLPLPPRRVFGVIEASNSHEKIHDKYYWKHRNDFAVKTEDKHKHKRQITPGDYKRKLRQETIEILNHEFEDLLTRMEYEV